MSQFTKLNPIGKMKEYKNFRLGMFLIIGFVLLGLIASSFYTVEEGNRGVVLRSGQIYGVAEPGLGMKLPFFDRVVMVDVRTQKVSSKSSGHSFDNQTVNTDIALNYHYDTARLGKIYSQHGLNLRENVIIPRTDETVKAVIAKFTARKLIADRASVKIAVDDALRQELAKYSIVVESVMITSFAFNDKYQEAVESTQIAEQRVLQATQELEVAKKTSAKEIELARGNAEAARITAESLRTQGGEEYVRLEAVKRWDGKLPTYMTGGAPVPFVNIK